MPDSTPHTTSSTASQPSTEEGRTSTCHVRVLLFSVLKEKIGAAELAVDLEAPATGEDLLDALTEMYPSVDAHRASLRIAVNQEYASQTTTLQDGDEVALITPVSGG